MSWRVEKNESTDSAVDPRPAPEAGQPGGPKSSALQQIVQSIIGKLDPSFELKQGTRQEGLMGHQ